MILTEGEDGRMKKTDIFIGLKSFLLIAAAGAGAVIIIGVLLLMYLFPQPDDGYDKTIYSVVVKNVSDSEYIDAEILLGRDEQPYCIEQDIEKGENRKINISTKKDDLGDYDVPYNIKVVVHTEDGSEASSAVGYFVENQGGLELLKVYEDNGTAHIKTFDIYDRANFEYNMTLRRHYKNQTETSWFSVI